MPRLPAPDEDEVGADLARRAGIVATRLLADRGLIYLEDLAPEDARELLRAAWREAAVDRFGAADSADLLAEVDVMIDSLVMTVRTDRDRLH
nr:hypothetical protein [uncultured Brevundimonas sp.]